MERQDDSNINMLNLSRQGYEPECADFVPVAIPKTLTESQALKAELEGHEIPTLLEGEQSAQMELPQSEKGLAVLVPEHMLEAASELVMNRTMEVPDDRDEIDSLDDFDDDELVDDPDDEFEDDEFEDDDDDDDDEEDDDDDDWDDDDYDLDDDDDLLDDELDDDDEFSEDENLL